MKIYPVIPAAIVLIFILIFMIANYKLSLTQQYRQRIESSQNSNNNFYLREPWNISNTDKLYTTELIPQANIIAIHQLDIQTWVKFFKTNDKQEEYGDGIIYGNMLTGDDNRQIRLYYFKPDKNWVLEYRRGEGFKFFPVFDYQIKNNTISTPIVIKVSKDGKDVLITFPNDFPNARSIHLGDSLYDVTNNMYLGIFLTKNTNCTVEIFNVVQ